MSSLKTALHDTIESFGIFKGVVIIVFIIFLVSYLKFNKKLQRRLGDIEDELTKLNIDYTTNSNESDLHDIKDHLTNIEDKLDGIEDVVSSR